MRRLERVDVDPALGAVVDVLTCPAGHKLEVVSISFYNDLVHEYDWYFYQHVGSSYLARDLVKVDTTTQAICKPYNGLVIYPGESVTLYCFTAGTTHIPMPIEYVDVSPI